MQKKQMKALHLTPGITAMEEHKTPLLKKSSAVRDYPDIGDTHVARLNRRGFCQQGAFRHLGPY